VDEDQQLYVTRYISDGSWMPCFTVRKRLSVKDCRTCQ